MLKGSTQINQTRPPWNKSAQDGKRGGACSGCVERESPQGCRAVLTRAGTTCTKDTRCQALQSQRTRAHNEIAHKMVPYKHAPSNIQARCMLRKNSAFLLLIALLFFFPLITNVNSVSTINCMENTYLRSKTTIPLSTKTQYFCVVWFFSY